MNLDTHRTRSASGPTASRAPHRRLAIGLSAALFASAALVGVGAAAPAMAAGPFLCETGFYGASNDGLFGGNPADGEWSPIATNPGGGFNALAYNPLDDHLYAIQGGDNHLLRFDVDGAVTDLGDVGLPSGSYSKATFDETGLMWVGNYPNFRAIDVANLTYSSVVASGAGPTGAITMNVVADFAYHDGDLVVVDTAGPRVTRIDIDADSAEYGQVVWQSKPILDFPSYLYPANINSVWSTESGQLFLGNAIGDIWEIVAPYGDAPRAVLRASMPGAGTGDGASCYSAAPPWGIRAEDDDFTAAPLSSTDGGRLGSVFDNDRILHSDAPVSAGGAGVNALLQPPGDNATAAALDPVTGEVSIPAGTRPGSYELDYEICEAEVSDSCDAATIEFVVTGEVIDDRATAGPGRTPVEIDVLANDTAPGVTFDSASVRLRHPDAAGDGRFLAIAGVGAWQVDPVSGAVTFTADDGFAGPTPSVEYGVVGDDGATYVADIDVTVFGRAMSDAAMILPEEHSVTIDLLGNDRQSLPDGVVLDSSSVRLIDPASGEMSSSVVVPQGTWTVQRSGDVVFAPVAGYVGSTPAIGYVVTGTDGVEYVADATVTAVGTVTADVADGVGGEAVAVDALRNDRVDGVVLDPTTVRLIDPQTRDAVKSLVVSGVGRWAVDVQTGDVVFTPASGFDGEAPVVTYMVVGDDGNLYAAGITVTIAPVVAPVHGGNGALATTGTRIPWVAAGAGLVLVIGGALALAVRRRDRRSTR